jgi:hypothetical protein
VKRSTTRQFTKETLSTTNRNNEKHPLVQGVIHQPKKTTSINVGDHHYQKNNEGTKLNRKFSSPFLRRLPLLVYTYKYNVMIVKRP